MFPNLVSRNQFCFVAFMVFSLIEIRPATASAFFSFDEWGKGFACDDGNGVPTPGINFCSFNPATQMGSFSRIPSGFSSDPTPGGGTHVLTYLLPFSLGNDDIYLRAPDDTAPTDLIRLIAGSGASTTVLFYSLQEFPGTGDCSTMTPPATGCDGVADVPAIPPPRPGLGTSFPEGGPEGNNDGLFFKGSAPFNLITLIAHSDELITCPPIPNCGPMNIAPPPNNPFRDITGLGAGVVPVVLPAPNAFDPIPGPVPEPGSIWLILLGATFSTIWQHRKPPASRRF
jgi:hypothetical protein